MSLPELLAEARQFAQEIMVDRCVITRKSDVPPVLDRGTGEYVEVPPSTVYDGVCRVQVPGIISVTSTTEVQAAQREWSVQAIILQLPVLTSQGVLIDDIVKILEAENDPELIGREYVVTGLHAKTHATSRRLRCEESSP